MSTTTAAQTCTAACSTLTPSLDCNPLVNALADQFPGAIAEECPEDQTIIDQVSAGGVYYEGDLGSVTACRRPNSSSEAFDSRTQCDQTATLLGSTWRQVCACGSFEAIRRTILATPPPSPPAAPSPSPSPPPPTNSAAATDASSVLLALLIAAALYNGI